MKIRKNRRGLQAQLSDAETRARGALDIFEAAAVELETAAEEADTVRLDAEVRVQELTQVRDSAFRTSASYQSKAEKIREFTR